MGQRDIRRLLVAGGMAVIVSKQRYDASNMSPWLMRMLDEKPKKVVAVAWANRMARVCGTSWCMAPHATRPEAASADRVHDGAEPSVGRMRQMVRRDQGRHEDGIMPSHRR